MSAHRWLVRYRKHAGAKWRRKPKFITPATGYRTEAAAAKEANRLREAGYGAHHARYDHLRVLALSHARKLIGTMEHGGNNQGAKVMEIIRANSGTGPEPWCGDFVAWCYREAGSNAVTRSWAAVRLLSGIAGLKVRGKRKAVAGDLVRFTFDHVGIVEAYCNASGSVRDAATATHMRTIEGNTGATGAVSDSTTGGDGVYRKIRPLTLVRDVIEVTR